MLTSSALTAGGNASLRSCSGARAEVKLLRLQLGGLRRHSYIQDAVAPQTDLGTPRSSNPDSKASSADAAVYQLNPRERELQKRA